MNGWDIPYKSFKEAQVILAEESLERKRAQEKKEDDPHFQFLKGFHEAIIEEGSNAEHVEAQLKKDITNRVTCYYAGYQAGAKWEKDTVAPYWTRGEMLWEEYIK